MTETFTVVLTESSSHFPVNSASSSLLFDCLSYMRANQDAGSAGAGGNWPAKGEQPDARVVAQEKPVYCGCACALTAFGVLQLTTSASQDDLFDRGGAMPFSVETLSGVMNDVWSASNGHGMWLGQGVRPDDAGDYLSVIGALIRSGPWIAHLRDGQSRLGHFIVVTRELDGALEILDPAVPGTSYTMSAATFLDYWNYQVVYLRRENGTI